MKKTVAAKGEMRVLLIEDDPNSTKALVQALRSLQDVPCKLTHEATLLKVQERLKAEKFDVILLDLDLPDSRGVNTFLDVHAHAAHTPILVLAGQENDAVVEAALSQGAYDYLVKQQLEAPLLARSIRYAVERARLQAELAETRLRERHASEITDVERITRSPGTTVTASMYAGGALRETAPEEFSVIAERYAKVLDAALENRMHKEVDSFSGEVREIADELGYLKASPRDVIDIHTAALRTKTRNAPWEKAQAYLEEGRLTVLELMGNLASHYRNYYISPIGGRPCTNSH